MTDENDYASSNLNLNIRGSALNKNQVLQKKRNTVIRNSGLCVNIDYILRGSALEKLNLEQDAQEELEDKRMMEEERSRLKRRSPQAAKETETETVTVENQKRNEKSLSKIPIIASSQMENCEEVKWEKEMEEE